MYRVETKLNIVHVQKRYCRGKGVTFCSALTER